MRAHALWDVMPHDAARAAHSDRQRRSLAAPAPLFGSAGAIVRMQARRLPPAPQIKSLQSELGTLQKSTKAVTGEEKAKLLHTLAEAHATITGVGPGGDL